MHAQASNNLHVYKIGQSITVLFVRDRPYMCHYSRSESIICITLMAKHDEQQLLLIYRLTTTKNKTRIILELLRPIKLWQKRLYFLCRLRPTPPPIGAAVFRPGGTHESQPIQECTSGYCGYIQHGGLGHAGDGVEVCDEIAACEGEEERVVDVEEQRVLVEGGDEVRKGAVVVHLENLVQEPHRGPHVGLHRGVKGSVLLAARGGGGGVVTRVLLPGILAEWSVLEVWRKEGGGGEEMGAE